MVFSSINGFLDPPNWHQQHDHQQHGGSVAGDGSLQLPPPPPVTAAGGSIRPGSMAERARLAKIPQPETALKCPRCESTNTKFCYFNNYNLSQPRHFCKTCRRYWTKGGALRNVPVGGGCRRNKRSKASNRSKSPAKVVGTNSTSPLVSNSCPNNIGHIPSTIPHLPILPPLHHLTDFSSTNIGLNFQPPVAGGGLGFQIGSASGASGLVDQWRLQQQVPFLGHLEAPNGGLYQFESEGYVGQLRSKALESGINQVKMEDNHQNHDNQGLNLSKNFLGISGNDQYWTATNNNNNTNNSNAWADLPGFTSSSSSHLL